VAELGNVLIIKILVSWLNAILTNIAVWCKAFHIVVNIPTDSHLTKY